MTDEKNLTQKTITMLLAGKSKNAKQFAGKHVLVVKNKIIPMKKGEAFWRDFYNLKDKYNETPISLFVPHPDMSYILILSITALPKPSLIKE